MKEAEGNRNRDRGRKRVKMRDRTREREKEIGGIERVKKREGESLSRHLNHSGTHASINYSAKTNSIKNVRTVSSEFE